MAPGNIDRGEAQFNCAELIALRNLFGQYAVVEFSFHFVRLQVVVCVVAGNLLPHTGIVADIYVHLVSFPGKMLRKDAAEVLIDSMHRFVPVERTRTDQARQPHPVGH